MTETAGGDAAQQPTDEVNRKARQSCVLSLAGWALRLLSVVLLGMGGYVAYNQLYLLCYPVAWSLQMIIHILALPYGHLALEEIRTTRERGRDVAILALLASYGNLALHVGLTLGQIGLALLPCDYLTLIFSWFRLDPGC